MADAVTHTPTEAEKKAIASLTRPQPGFGAFRAASAAEEKKRQEEEEARIVTNAKVGDKMPDGTIYAGISPDTNERMYAAPADAALSMDFNKAAKYAEDLEVGDKKDFRVPTKAELNVLFENREKGALKGAFNLTGSNPAGWYWSSTPCNGNYAYVQRFIDGKQNSSDRYIDSSVRCVR